MNVNLSCTLGLRGRFLRWYKTSGTRRCLPASWGLIELALELIDASAASVVLSAVLFDELIKLRVLLVRKARHVEVLVHWGVDTLGRIIGGSEVINLHVVLVLDYWLELLRLALGARFLVAAPVRHLSGTRLALQGLNL